MFQYIYKLLTCTALISNCSRDLTKVFLTNITNSKKYLATLVFMWSSVTTKSSLGLESANFDEVNNRSNPTIDEDTTSACSGHFLSCFNIFNDNWLLHGSHPWFRQQNPNEINFSLQKFPSARLLSTKPRRWMIVTDFANCKKIRFFNCWVTFHLQLNKSWSKQAHHKLHSKKHHGYWVLHLEPQETVLEPVTW